MKSKLAITGVGLLTPIGLCATDCLHCVRCSITRLEVKPYRDVTNKLVVGGSIYAAIRFVRERRLGEMAVTAITEACRQAAGGEDLTNLLPVAVLLGAPENGRPGYKFPFSKLNLHTWLARVGLSSVSLVEVVEGGAASAQMSLQRAFRVLESGKAKTCVLGAVDNQLQIQVVRWHENHYRLKCSYLTDGLMPAEAASFLVVETEQDALKRGAPILARILSTASDTEPANILSDQPNTARGLTNAARTALRDAGVEAKDLDAVCCDLNGESYRGREWAFTEIRLGVQTHTELIHPADCHGDLGSATDANLLALAALSQATGWANGKPQLVFSGSEGGIRAATVIGPPPGKPPLLQVTRELPRVLPVAVEVPPLGPDDANPLESEDPPRAYFEWELRQEHLEEIASLYYQRRAIIHNGEVPWIRAREPEQRILNHLDAVVAGGPASIWAVASGLLDGEEGKAFAGALLLGILPTRTNLSRLDSALKPERSVLAGIEAGLKHAPPSKALLLHVETWLDHAEPFVRAIAAAVLADHRELDASRVVSFINSNDSRVRLAGIRAARQQRHERAVPALERLLTAADPNLVFETMLTLLCLGQQNVREWCRKLALNGSAPSVRAPWLLALCGQSMDFQALIRAKNALDDPVNLKALGILGNVQAAPYLLQALEAADDVAKLAAAEALELMTASGLHEKAVVVEKTELLPGEFVEAQREVERVATVPEVWREWWAKNGRNFSPLHRWRRGQPFDFGIVIAELKDPATRFEDRQRCYWELVIQTGQFFPFEPDWFVARQQKALAEWDSWWAANKPP